MLTAWSIYSLILVYFPIVISLSHKRGLSGLPDFQLFDNQQHRFNKFNFIFFPRLNKTKTSSSLFSQLPIKTMPSQFCLFLTCLLLLICGSQSEQLKRRKFTYKVIWSWNFPQRWSGQPSQLLLPNSFTNSKQKLGRLLSI